MRNNYLDYISHHGIEGQMWGKRNGPPYPLDPEKDYSPREKRLAKKVSNEFANNLNSNQSKFFRHKKEDRYMSEKIKEFRNGNIANDLRQKHNVDKIKNEVDESFKKFKEEVRKAGIEDEDQLTSENTTPEIESAYKKYIKKDNDYYKALREMSIDFINSYSDVSIDDISNNYRYFNDDYDFGRQGDYFTNKEIYNTKYEREKNYKSPSLDKAKMFIDYKIASIKDDAYKK